MDIHELNKDELFAHYIYDLTNNDDLTRSIVEIHNILYHTDGKPVVEVDPSYKDAVIKFEPMPKDPCGCFCVDTEPSDEEKLAKMRHDLDDMIAGYHERVFDPVGTIAKQNFLNQNPLNKYLLEKPEESPYYKRF